MSDSVLTRSRNWIATPNVLIALAHDVDDTAREAVGLSTWAADRSATNSAGLLADDPAAWDTAFQDVLARLGWITDGFEQQSFSPSDDEGGTRPSREIAEIVRAELGGASPTPDLLRRLAADATWPARPRLIGVVRASDAPRLVTLLLDVTPATASEHPPADTSEPVTEPAAGLGTSSGSSRGAFSTIRGAQRSLTLNETLFAPLRSSLRRRRAEQETDGRKKAPERHE